LDLAEGADRSVRARALSRAAERPALSAAGPQDARSRAHIGPERRDNRHAVEHPGLGRSRAQSCSTLADRCRCEATVAAGCDGRAAHGSPLASCPPARDVPHSIPSPPETRNPRDRRCRRVRSMTTFPDQYPRPGRDCCGTLLRQRASVPIAKLASISRSSH